VALARHAVLAAGHGRDLRIWQLARPSLPPEPCSHGVAVAAVTAVAPDGQPIAEQTRKISDRRRQKVDRRRGLSENGITKQLS
jgi:hypothetical protein